MQKTLVLAEKPSVGRNLARILKCHTKHNGYMEGQNYIVTWALGHLVTLADPELYHSSYKAWKIEDLPILPAPFKLVVIKKTSKQFHCVKDQMKRKDVTKIVIATDAGREGELVARWIIEKAHVKKPIQRLWISSVTDKAIRDGFNRLKSGKSYEKLYDSAYARAAADWVVGINATRALTCKYNAQLSCGRVQTPTLAMIAAREEEIRNFKSKTFYGISVKSQGVEWIWQNTQTNDTRLFDKQKCEQVHKKIRNEKVKILDVKKTIKKSYAPQLYDLTELQREANRLFDFSAKETVSILQGLYERHKVLTYPRTDSRYLTSDIVDTLKDRIKACRVKPYASLAIKLINKPIPVHSSYVDNRKVSDHHAIIPTEESVPLSVLSDKERKIYDLVVLRFFSVMYPPYEYEQLTIKAKIGDETFITKGKSILSIGWKEVYQKEKDQRIDEIDKHLSSIRVGDAFSIDHIELTKGQTHPPAPFNEGTLLSAMENPSHYMKDKDKELIKTLGKTGGLGTVATRADIIEKLFNTFLVEKRNKDIYITSKGRQLLQLVPSDLKTPALTAEWERKLEMISQGNLNKNVFIDEMKTYSKTAVREIKDSSEKYKHDNLTYTRCPKCGQLMLQVNGKKGKMLICQDRNCGYKKVLSKPTNIRCPKCHKKMELSGEGERQVLVCSCGFKEKLSTYHERRKKQTKSLSKREVNSYLKKQHKSDKKTLNTGFADALSKIKLDE